MTAIYVTILVCTANFIGVRQNGCPPIFVAQLYFLAHPFTVVYPKFDGLSLRLGV